MAESSKRPADLAKPNSSQESPSTRPRSASWAETNRAAAADSVPMAGGATALLPKNFGRYQVLRELGRGQMGAVYLALDTELDRSVALKVARVSSTGSAKLLKRMEIEAKSAAKVDHPLICKVYDAGEIDGIRFIALQYVEGEDLKKYLARVGRWREPDEAVRIVLQILGALSAAHEKQVIHRDLKPENIMLNKNQEPVIMDFGLARHAIGSSNAGLTQGMIVGTAAYMSPEQATGRAEEIDHRSDLYAVGVMLFEMLTGEWPFTGGSVEVMGKKCVLEAPSPLSLNANLYPQLAAVCHKMIAKKKEDRYSTCADAILAIEEIDLTESLLPESAFEVVPQAQLDFLNSPTAKLTKAKTSQTSTRSNPPPLRSKSSQKSGGRGGELRAPSSNEKTRSVPWTVIGGSGVCLIGLAAVLIYSMSSKPNSIRTSTETANATPVIPSQNEIDALPLQGESIAVVRNESRPLPFEIITDVNRSDISHTTSEPPIPSIEAVVVPASVVEMTSASDSQQNSEMDNEAMTKEEIVGIPSGTEGDSSDSVDALIEKGLSLVRANQRKEAMTPLKRASNLAPKEPRADFYLGFLYLGSGAKEPKEAKAKIESAEIHFNKAFNRTADRTPERAAAANNLALVELKLRKISAARNYFGIAAKQNPRPAEVNHNLGRLLGQTKNFDIKADELKKINALIAEPADYRPQSGWIYLPLDRSEKTLNECKTFSPSGFLEDVSCNLCNGCAKLICKPCVGKGKVPVLGTVSEKRDIGFGMTASSTGSTTNLVVCRECGGSGRVDCKGCADGRDPGLRR